MKKGILNGLAALSVVGAIGSLVAPAAMAGGPDYQTWRDSVEVRQDMREVRGENRQIAADRARLRTDLNRGHYREAQQDQRILHSDQRLRGATKANERMERQDLHHDYWNR